MIISKLRARLTYSNVVATLALFLVLAGGGAWAAKKLKLKPNSVRSKHIAPDAATGEDVNEATLGPVPSALHANTADTASTANTADTANSASPTGAAGGDLSGTYPDPVVGPDAIGAAEIQNTSRSFSLPLASFVNDTDQTTIDFTPSDGTSPDFDISSNILVLEWDDNATGVADTDFVQSNFSIPADYASGGVFTIHFSKDGNTPPMERFDCQVAFNGSFGAHAFTDAFGSGPAAVALALVPPNPYVVGPPVDVRCAVQDSTGGNTSNDVVRISDITFIYNAKQ
ncbi:MAG TPA: hypothetical protein VEK39_00505 [Solirubrobacterales bacterium]|nr:hypothetical protein [Solirubrobacterales bacterium]